jgi:translation initiation factor 5B
MSAESENKVRSPIGVIMGHVDSGKTSLLDKVRKTAVQVREAGGITQHIGASFFPAETIEEMSFPLHQGKVKLKIPGLLMVDTPGHAAFMNLRSRGASVADIAIVVVDLTKGFQAQTFESINLLKRRKVPFVIAANKIDRGTAWKGMEDTPFIKSYNQQNVTAKAALDSHIYEVQGELGQIGLESDRYDKVKKFSEKVAIVPTSATTGEGIADLFLVLAGLTQQYLMEKLKSTDGFGKGVILEVKEEQGLGTTLDVILYEGSIFANDLVVLGGKNGAIITKLRALLLPKDLDEMRDPRDKFTKVSEVHAAIGVKVIGSEFGDAMSGSPFFVAENKAHAEELAKEVESEISEFKISTDDEGIVLRTDTLGSLEALVGMLRENNIKIRSADVGDISKRDVMDAVITAQRNEMFGAILNFGVKITEDAEELADNEAIHIFSDPIIYGLVDQYLDWKSEIEAKQKALEKGNIKKPTKLKLMPDMIFRNNKPAIVGVEILSGEIEPRDVLLNEENKRVGQIVQIRYNNEPVKIATTGMQVAISIRGPTIGRQIQKDEELYIDMRHQNGLLIMQKHMEKLTEAEKNVFIELELLKKKSGLKFWPFTG